jgi:hypothetical protein
MPGVAGDRGVVGNLADGRDLGHAEASRSRLWDNRRGMRLEGSPGLLAYDAVHLETSGALEVAYLSVRNWAEVSICLWPARQEGLHVANFHTAIALGEYGALCRHLSTSP